MKCVFCGKNRSPDSPEESECSRPLYGAPKYESKGMLTLSSECKHCKTKKEEHHGDNHDCPVCCNCAESKGQWKNYNQLACKQCKTRKFEPKGCCEIQ